MQKKPHTLLAVKFREWGYENDTRKHFHLPYNHTAPRLMERMRGLLSDSDGNVLSQHRDGGLIQAL